jgi:hypothetical protein
VGAVLINVINRAYAKKVLVQLPGQTHPLHFHKLKEETFLVLWGELISELESERAFGRKAESFFSAMISRCGVEDFDVFMFDKSHRKCGTLHDHHTQETANAND